MKTLRPLEATECIYGKNYKGIITNTWEFFQERNMQPYQEVCIDTPPQTERDWGDVVDKLAKSADKHHGHYSFRMDALRILQQADKPAPAPSKKSVKLWINIEQNASYCKAFDSKEKADTMAYDQREACKEIEIEYEPGEGLND